MSEIYLVRHGQAAFGARNYDELSKRGHRQAELLADHWAALQQRFDAVYAGELEHQIDSATTVLKRLQERGAHVLELEIRGAFNEFSFQPILKSHEQNLRAAEPPVAIDWASIWSDRRACYAFLEGALHSWTRGELSGAEIEPRQAFCDRCVAGVQSIVQSHGRGASVAVFTSSGAISVILQHVLGIDDATTIGLELAMYNACVTKLLYNDDQVSLASFNTIGHLEIAGDDTLITYL